MKNDGNSWIDEVEKANSERQEGEYFKFSEGDNRIQLLTHCAQLIQRWNGSKYEVMIEGDSQEGRSIKGVCYVLQDNEVKLAFLPYSVVKQIRALQQDPDYAFTDFPMPRLINIKAKNAGSKEVEYSVIPSPKETKVAEAIMFKLEKKNTPESIVEAMKAKREGKKVEKPIDYPEESSDGIPF